ncbi:hypothetical protein M6I34_09285 [Burkholderiaceae bacterium FT117]|uniref:PP0621 family protein n=1 Tax=Zeimonas sediminis TaxID=2944268 RepID=UPI002342F3DE|nr:PP0621 family protein [Zeimonas sediminis]MCM5570700.1 hypothetical protein [Zeimonas sediminis]
MGKLLFWVVVIAVGWGVWSLVRVSQRKSEQARQAAARRGPEKIVACAHCGVHLPASEAVRGDGEDYCCAEHRDAGPR